MAKKKLANESPQPAVIDTAELAGDGANPRRINERAAGGLASSLKRFGDLSGIVWNSRTSELVCGHQRMQQIRQQWGDRPVELIDAANRLYGIRIDADHFFAVRVVDWSKALQRAANVAANSQQIAGEFTDDLTAYLLEVEADLSVEAPGLLDDVLLVDLLSMESEDDGADAKEQQIAESYQIIVQCADEAHQRRVYDELTKEGLACKVLTL